MTKTELAAVCWAALEKVAKKECRRDLLPAGAKYDAVLHVRGELKKKTFAAEIEAHLTVNHDGSRLASQAPETPELVAYLLSQLPRRRREALLEELPEQFAKAKQRLPEVEAGLLEAAENLLGRLRAKVQKPVSGSISASYTLHKVSS